MLDVSPLLDNPIFRQTFVIRRPGPVVTDDSGLAAAPVSSLLMGSGVVQPAGPADVDVLPQGTNLSATISVWSRAEIKCDDGDGQLSDIIEWRGTRYRVIRLENRSADGNYYRAYATRYAS